MNGKSKKIPIRSKGLLPTIDNLIKVAAYYAGKNQTRARILTSAKHDVFLFVSLTGEFPASKEARADADWMQAVIELSGLRGIGLDYWEAVCFACECGHRWVGGVRNETGRTVDSLNGLCPECGKEWIDGLELRELHKKRK